MINDFDSGVSFYLFRRVSLDELLINTCCFPCQLLLAIIGFEVFAGEPEVQILLAELRFQKVPKC